MTSAQRLEQIFGLSFHPVSSIQMLRQFHYPNAFCTNEEGDIVGICAIKNEGVELNISIPRDLNRLQYLNLSSNNSLTSLEFESTMAELEHLDMSDGKLKSLKIPAGCHKLRWLDVSRNEMESFVMMGECRSLVHLDLSNNVLRNFKGELMSKFPDLERLYLKNNPLPDSKKSSVEKQANCIHFMRAFWREIQEKGSTENNEYKILVVGNGGVGKSCLIERLVHDRFEKHHLSTHGVQIENNVSLIQYGGKSKFPYILNIWDFGGQDIYHETHRLFMQSKAIYLVLWDDDTFEKEYSTIIENNVPRQYENRKLSYWLHYIQQLGGESPVIVIKTKAKTPTRGLAEDLSQRAIKQAEEIALLKLKFEKVFSRLDFHEVDSAITDWTENGFKRLLDYLKDSIASLKRDEELPNSWIRLRQHLRNLQVKKDKTLSFDEYMGIASDYVEEEESMNILENWLVPSGVVFYRKGYFHDAIILDQAWAIKAIYTLFNRTQKVGYYHFIEKNQGKFTGEDLISVWKDRSDAERQLFVSFMLSCELCFEITQKEEDKQIEFKDRVFVAPQLMSKERPEGTIKYFRKNQDLLHIRFEHILLHYGIIQSFIVQTQSLANVDNIWRNGILIEEKGISALIQAEKNEIHVEVPIEGLELLGKIRNLLIDIQGEKVIEKVSLDDKDYVLMDNLKNYKGKSIPTVDGRQTVETGDLQVFLDHKTQAKFELKKGENVDESVMEAFEKKQLMEDFSAKEPVSTKVEFEEYPVNILFIAANPDKNRLISWEEEYTTISGKLSTFITENKYKLHQYDTSSLMDILDAIDDTEPVIIHFCGHGKEEEMNAKGVINDFGGIMVHNESKSAPEFLDAETLDIQFQEVKADCTNLTLVFLNACHSAPQAQAISKHGIYTLGTTEEIISKAARLFAAGFYRQLVKKKDIFLAIRAGVTRAISVDKDIKSRINLYYNGKQIYPQ